jgi:hypothetical protein
MKSFVYICRSLRYRWLFMLLSRYNYLNTLTPLEP